MDREKVDVLMGEETPSKNVTEVPAGPCAISLEYSNQKSASDVIGTRESSDSLTVATASNTTEPISPAEGDKQVSEDSAAIGTFLKEQGKNTNVLYKS